MTNDSHKARLAALVQELSVIHEKVTLASGRESDFYVDMRRSTLHHEAAPLIGHVMLDLLEEAGFAVGEEYVAVGGLTMGADPVATAMLHAAASRGLDLDAFVVRKAAKDHGMKRRIEGPDVVGKNVVVLEDTSTTGGSPLEAALTLREAGANVVAVGHRIVQGGRYFDGPALITDEVRNLIEELCPLAPLHNPAHLKGIDVARELMPDVPHVAVFDTAFFQQLPDRSALYALETETAEKYSVRRYGAHGTSHQFVSQEIAKLEGRDDLKQIVLHLGNGASVSAVKNGKPIDTSMGLTPLEGLMMGTRTGDIDPAVVFHLQRVAGMSVDEVDTLFNKKSGMKGMTGESDMRSVWDMIHNDDDPEAQQRARTAMDVYINRLLKYVGSYTAALGGLGWASTLVVLLMVAGLAALTAYWLHAMRPPAPLSRSSPSPVNARGSIFMTFSPSLMLQTRSPPNENSAL